MRLCCGWRISKRRIIAENKMQAKNQGEDANGAHLGKESRYLWLGLPPSIATAFFTVGFLQLKRQQVASLCGEENAAKASST